LQNEINFQYTEADFRSFMAYYYRHGAGRKSLYILGIAGLVAAAWPFFSSGFNVVSLISAVFTLILMAAIWYFTLRFSSGRVFKANKQMQEKRHCVYDAEKIVIQGETFSSDYTWNAFSQVVETPESFLLFTTGMSAVILPKTAFSETQMAEFRKLAAI
jgi:hypothetical protein